MFFIKHAQVFCKALVVFIKKYEYLCTHRKSYSIE